MKKIYLLVLLTGLALFVFDCKKETPKPSASFSYSINNYNPGEVDFYNLSSNSTSYEWNFGDGVTSYETNPTHVYSANGYYTVSMIATGDGGSSSTMQTISITNIVVPVASFTFYVYSSYQGLVDFTNTSSNADSYTWDFGDGAGSYDVNPSHTFSQNGSYYVTLTATGNGGSNTAGQYVDITNVVSNTQICAWTSMATYPCYTAEINIYIDDVYEGYLYQYYTSTPSCGASGTITVDVSSGTHKFYAACNSGTTTWGPVYYNVDYGTCFKWQLINKGLSLTSKSTDPIPVSKKPNIPKPANTEL